MDAHCPRSKDGKHHPVMDGPRLRCKSCRQQLCEPHCTDSHPDSDFEFVQGDAVCTVCQTPVTLYARA